MRRRVPRRANPITWISRDKVATAGGILVRSGWSTSAKGVTAGRGATRGGGREVGTPGRSGGVGPETGNLEIEVMGV
jgi:hypothetical protein